MTPTAEVIRDDKGVPLRAVIKDGGKQLLEFTNSEAGWTIEGSRRNLTPENIALLRLLLPVQEKTDFTIPQPLQTVQVNTGTILLYDDFEALCKWTAATGAVANDNTVAFNGGQSLKITSPVGAIANVYRGLPWGTKDTKSVEVKFAIADLTKLNSFAIQLYNWNLAENVIIGLQYVPATGVWSVLNSTGAQTTICTYPIEAIGARNIFHKVKVGFDGGNYRYFELDGNRYDRAIGHPRGIMAPVNAYSFALLSVGGVAGQIAIMNFDDFAVQEE